MIAVYVDDILIFSKKGTDIESVNDGLKSFHPMKDLEKLRNDEFLYKTLIEVSSASNLDDFGTLNRKDQDSPVSPSAHLDRGSETCVGVVTLQH